MMGTIRSHKYFPEFIIRSFYGNGVVNYLNVEKCKIISVENSKKYNVEKG